MVDLRRVRVKLVSRNDTFVALPREGADEFHGRGIKGPIPLELVELQPPCRRHLVAFAGQASSTANCIELSRQYAQCLGIRDGAMVRVHESLRDLPVATRVVVAPVTEGDYAAVSISAKAAEDGDVLSQVALVSIGLSFPLWVDRNKQLVMFTVKDLEFPKGAKHPSGMIRTGSELVVVQPQQQNGRPRGAKVNGKPKSQSSQSVPPGRMITEARLLCLSLETAADLGLDRAILDWGAASESRGDGDYGLWDISKGYAGPGVVNRLLASDGIRASSEDGSLPSSSSSELEIESVLVKVVPKVLEAAAGGEGRIGGTLGTMSPVCITLVTSNLVPKGHLALPPPLVQTLGVQDKHRIVLVAVDCASQSITDLATFNMEVSQIVDTGAEEATASEEGTEDDALAKWGADTTTCEKMVNAIIGTMNDSTTAAVVLSKGMIFEVFHRKTRSSLQFLITSISPPGPEDRLGDLGGMHHAFIGALAAEKGGVEAEVTLGQPITAAAKGKTHPHSVGFRTRVHGTDDLGCLESPWLAESRDRCIQWLQMALDEGLSAHFFRLGIDFPGGVLVHGPTGSGKTVLCESICAHFSKDLKKFATKVVWLDCEDFVSIDPEKMKRKLRVAVSRAAECQPSLVVIENVDIFASQGADAGAGQAVMETYQNAVFAETLCDLMDALREGRHRVAFLATCRSLEGTHKSVKQSGCFDTHFAMPVPSRKQKAEIFGNLAKAKNISFVSEDEALDYLSRNCDGLDVADLSRVLELAMHACLVNVTQGKSRGLVISQEELRSILSTYVPAKSRGVACHMVDKSDDKISDWADIKGMTRAKAQLEDLLSFPSKHKDLVEQCPLRLRTGALLYGPPGCGKTFLVKCAAKICNLRVISVKGPELLNKYIGASEAGVRELFQKASNASPCLLFFDEFDSIAPKRGHDSTGVTDRVVNQFLAELDGIESLVGVFVLAATSRPDLVDGALLRPGRLDMRIKLDFPDFEERMEIIRQGMPSLGGELLVDLARRTPGYSGADLMGLLGEAELLAAQKTLEMSEKSSQKEAGPQAREASATELQEALATSRPSVDDQQRRHLDMIYDSFSTTRTTGEAQSEDEGANKLRVTHA